MKTVIEIVTYWPVLSAGFAAAVALLPWVARDENRIQR